MRKLIFYLLSFEPKLNAVNILENYNSPWIKFKDKNAFFIPPQSPAEKILLGYNFLKINEVLSNTLYEILINSYIQAKHISSERMGVEIQENSIKNAICIKVNTYAYITTGKDIFDFCLDFFVLILMGHYLDNGNKRTAFVFLINVLWSFGYYFKFTKGVYRNYEVHKQKMEYFVTILERKKANNHDNAKREIKGWILENVIIGFNWR